ncbi:MAG: SPOR domain-containing protein, partial [Bacteroidaceae bacterium]|nr:SPOR domain-containing protein [Bacteroidaceae bacterium]
DDVAKMRELLRSNMELQIGTIGTLQLTLNYSLMFTPSDECGLFAKEFYGLVQAPLPSEAHRVALSQSTYTASPAGPETNKPQTTKTIYNDNTHYVIRVSKNAVRYTVTTIAAALLYFMFTIAPNVEPVIDNSVQQAGIIITKPQSNKATQTQSLETKNTETLQQHNTKTNNSATPDSETDRALFTLVLASKVTAKGANHLVQELKESGFSEAQVIDDDGMTRVIYSTYPTDNDAYMAAKQLRTQHKSFRSAWVMQMEK